MSAVLDRTAVPSRKTALNATHRQLGAKMVNFNGWDMPLEYPASGGLMAEHLAVRKAAGIFDVSHMGDIRIHGPGALAAVQHLTMNDVSRLAVQQCQYSALLYPEGTFVDDVVVHRLADNDYWLVINAGTREKDWGWVQEHVQPFDCMAEHLSDDLTQIAIQGPRAASILQRVTDADLSRLKFYWLTRGTVCGLKNIMIARTGYTSEDGLEIYLPADQASNATVWNELLLVGKEYGCLPCGLGARNTLRLEGALPLYGHEISAEINVWEAGLGRFCPMKEADFLGKSALQEYRAKGVARTLVGLEVSGGIARDGYRVLDASGGEIGYVTSGSYAPFLKKNIALAYVPPAFAQVDTAAGVDVRGRTLAAKIVPLPFYARPRR